MTGVVDNKGSVTVITSMSQKVVTGVLILLLAALILTGTSALTEWRGIKDTIPMNTERSILNEKQIQDMNTALVLITKDVDRHNAFAAQGPRVTSDDLAELQRLILEGEKDRTDLFKLFVSEQTTTNSRLAEISGQIGIISVKVENIEEEQDRARDRLDNP